MNEVIPATPGGPHALTVSIAPWPHPGPVDSTAIDTIRSRVDSDGAGATLTLWHADGATGARPLQALRRLMEAALPLAQTSANATITLSPSGVVLDTVQFAEALDEWRDDRVPVPSMVRFDFAVRGTPPGTRSIGLAALVGQEVICRPPSHALRLVAARLTARLAHDMLLHGPIVAEQVFAAPDAPRGEVRLVPRSGADSVVEIMFQ